MLTVPSLTNISLGPCLVQLRLQREKQDITQNRVWNIGYLDLLHIQRWLIKKIYFAFLHKAKDITGKQCKDDWFEFRTVYNPDPGTFS